MTVTASAGGIQPPFVTPVRTKAGARRMRQADKERSSNSRAALRTHSINVRGFHYDDQQEVRARTRPLRTCGRGECASEGTGSDSREHRGRWSVCCLDTNGEREWVWRRHGVLAEHGRYV